MRNIAQAKEEIIHTVQAYTAKDEKGNYKIPLVCQRPMLLMGPPGIGKTAIMKQIAREEKIGLVEIYADPSHPSECRGPAHSEKEKFWREGVHGNRIYHE